MSFNHILYEQRISGESGLLFELIKEHFKEEIYTYKSEKSQHITIKERGLFNQGSNIPAILNIFIFMTIYKMVDQLFEQILEDNGESPRKHFWTYEEKINRVKMIILKSTTILPKLLDVNNRVHLKSLFSFFEHKKEARNAIAHRRIEILSFNNYHVEFEDLTTSTSYDLNMGIHQAIEKYYLLRALTSNQSQYTIINRQVIMNEISNNPDKEIEKITLINNIGIAYEVEIDNFLNQLIKNNELEVNADKIKIKNKDK